MSDNTISKTILQYKELSQLQEFAQAQNTTILQLSKKNQKLEDQIKHLEELLKTTVPTISTVPAGIKDFIKDDSEYIATVEIAKLKSYTKDRSLTLEESRMFDTYYKILNNINTKPKKFEKDVEELDTGKLLELVESKENNGTDK